ncbi:Golgi phosphoprotein 3-domain-containing protein [Russula earlei]|uniref:Golgi phosphoprotein 3-domain-containing protein n=1 Tax=Russula earlei TaxID=71964 RepID=A0ACC0U4W0_9AGAM|nr:Golgi phosphoprotein 3-domain-containing protein [Russula earlei]
MSENSGLSRRRVNTGPASSSEPSPSLFASHAGSAFAGGNKIAFDPRDLERDEEESKTGGKIPHLTLMEEVLLLGLKDHQATQGYLSFWNDNISYALRGCILIELALRRRIAVHKDPNRRRLPLAERLVEVTDDRQTGETILDETLRMMKAQESERMSINAWVDLLSGTTAKHLTFYGFILTGETWNVLKIGYQLKQVRERLAKGLVDKGVLRTEKRNFLLFDMATHPVADLRVKDAVVSRIVALLTAGTSAVPPAAFEAPGTQMRALRSVCLACSAYAASVLDNAFARLGYEERETAFARCDDILAEFAAWPFGSGSLGSTGSKKREGPRIAMGSSSTNGREAVLGLLAEVRKELVEGDDDAGCELVAGVLEVLSKLDSLL